MKLLTGMCLILIALACSGQARGGSSSSSGNDPCTLVGRADAEQLLGPLRHDPYRVSGPNREPQPTGSYCFYEARNGRRVVMDVDWKDGKMGMQVLGMMGRLVEQAIPTDSGQADTLEGRWDELRMLPGDNLYARKGDQMVSIDYNGSGIGLIGAAKWAHIALGRFGHPLAYDGAAAGRTALGPLVKPGDPCALIDRADFERVVGALASAPTPTVHNDGCKYTLAQSRGLLGGRDVTLQVSWKDGFAAIENSRHTVDMVAGKVAPPVAHGSNTSAPSAQGAPASGNDPGFAGFMNKVMDVARSQGVGVQTNESGALKTDTAVVGPWDAGELHSGLGFMVVKHDAMLSLDLRGITYEQAKALLTKAVERIP